MEGADIWRLIPEGLPHTGQSNSTGEEKLHKRSSLALQTTQQYS
jgi:hypothetical protein